MTLDWTGRTRQRTTGSDWSRYEFGRGTVAVRFDVGPGPIGTTVGWYRGRTQPFALEIDEEGLTMDDMAGTNGRGRPDAALASFLGVSRRAGWFAFDFLADIVEGAPGGPREAHSGCCSYFQASVPDVPEAHWLQVPALLGVLTYEWRRRRAARR